MSFPTFVRFWDHKGYIEALTFLGTRYVKCYTLEHGVFKTDVPWQLEDLPDDVVYAITLGTEEDIWHTFHRYQEPKDE